MTMTQEQHNQPLPRSVCCLLLFSSTAVLFILICRYILPSESQTLPPIGIRPIASRDFLAQISTQTDPAVDNDDAMIDFCHAKEAVGLFGDSVGGSNPVNETHTPLKAKSPTIPTRTIPTTYLRFRKFNKCRGDSLDGCFQALSTIMEAQSCSVLQTNSVATINRFLLNSGRRKVGGALLNLLQAPVGFNCHLPL